MRDSDINLNDIHEVLSQFKINPFEHVQLIINDSNNLINMDEEWNLPER
jgi:hypothetical protein